MNKLTTSDPKRHKGGCLRYGATAFFALGAVTYLAMGITGDGIADQRIRPVLFLLSILFVFFIWLMWRPKKRQIRSGETNSRAESTETDTLPSETPVSYINDGGAIHRVDGQPLTDKDIEYLRETSFEQAQQYYENSPNPKFHRTFEEKIEQSKFYAANVEYIEKLEQDIWMPHLYSFDTIDEAIAHDRQALIAAQKLAEYCSKTSVGRQYFEDMWMHCHNSQNPDFNFIDRIKDRYSDLTLNYEERKKAFDLHKKRQAFLQHADDAVFQVIQENPGVLQKELHKHFDPDLKPTIGTVVSHLLKNDKIRREKCGNIYSLYEK